MLVLTLVPIANFATNVSSDAGFDAAIIARGTDAMTARSHATDGLYVSTATTRTSFTPSCPTFTVLRRTAALFYNTDLTTSQYLSALPLPRLLTTYRVSRLCFPTTPPRRVTNRVPIAAADSLLLSTALRAHLDRYHLSSSSQPTERPQAGHQDLAPPSTPTELSRL